MANFEQIKSLREKTSISMMDCKKALEESGGDENKAIEWLRKQGIKIAEKKSSRNTKAGLVECYVHGTGQIGVLLELRSETDFVAKNPEFKEIAHNLAMHIAASNPLGINKSDISKEIIEKEQEIYQAEVQKMGKPKAVAEQIVKGKLEKFYQEHCLLNQSYIRDLNITVAEFLNQAIQKFGENIEIARFERFEI